MAVHAADLLDLAASLPDSGEREYRDGATIRPARIFSTSTPYTAAALSCSTFRTTPSGSDASTSCA